MQGFLKSESMGREVKASAEGVALNISNQISIYQQLLSSIAKDKQLVDIFETADNSLLREKRGSVAATVAVCKICSATPG